MKKRLIALSLAFLLILCVGCQKKEAEPEFTEPSAAVEQPVEPVEEAPAETEAPAVPEATEAPIARSLTSGTPGEYTYHPMLVMIENSKAARPQTGIQQADIVYEILAESSVTRFMCLFNDTIPVEAGPIRSCRMYYLAIQKEWDAPIVHYGGPGDSGKPSNIYSDKYDYIKLRLDGLKSAKYTKYFWRSKDRKAPHNVYTNLVKMADAEYTYTPNERTQFTFADEVAYENGQAFTYVGLPWNTSNSDTTNFTYNAEDGLLYRANGDTPHEIVTVTEDESGKQTKKTAQYTCKNLIVQYAKTYVLDNDIKGRKNVDVVGSGNCEYFIGGKHMKGTWVRETEDSSTIYYLEDGTTPVTLLPGNTWIAVHPDTATVTVK